MNRRRYTVASLTKTIQESLRSRFTMVWVEGEVGQLQVPASGHCYLTLRGGEAILPAVMFRNEWRQCRHKPKLGDKVICRGRVDAYLRAGKYQLQVFEIQPAGEGRLAKELAQRKARLDADGLTDPRRRRPLPKVPRVVGLVTSATGAALQDFLRVSRERWPAAQIRLAPTVVQGPMAPPSIVQAVELLVDDGQAEVIVVTRGGGSKEDMMAFHDEQLARFLAHCPVPVVTAVGHETDTHLVDFVADHAAPTPSAAALAVLPDVNAAIQRVDEAWLSLQESMSRLTERLRRRTDELRGRLRHPGARAAEQRQRLQQLEDRLRRAIHVRLQTRKVAFTAHEQRLRPLGVRLIEAPQRRTETLEHELVRAMENIVRGRQEQLRLLEARLHGLSPRAVLNRGYAIVHGPEGVVSDSEDLAPSDTVAVQLAQGRFTAEVREVDSAGST